MRMTCGAFRRPAAAAAAALMLLCGGCRFRAEDFGVSQTPDVPVTEQVKLERLIIGYNETMPLDPFSETSEVNLQITKLCFEPLYELDAQMQPRGVLASADEKISDTEYRITLNGQRVFWDGSGVSPKDVVFSYQKAAASPFYSYLSLSIESVRADSDSVVVRLTRPNVNFRMALGFPVIKAVKHSRGGSDWPGYIGTGPYRPVFDGTARLEADAGHPDYGSCCVRTMILKNTPDFEAMNDSVAASIIQAGYSSLPGGKLPTISGNVYASDRNTMVYLGFCPGGKADQAELRRAVSAALDRGRLRAFYGGYAEAARTPFNPSFSKITGKCASLSYDPGAAEETAKNFSRLRLTLAVNEENAVRCGVADEIAGELENAGLKVRVKRLPYEMYRETALYGGCDMYLGETDVCPDFSFFEILGGAPGKPGAACSPELSAARDSYLSTGDESGFLERFDLELPFVPLLYRDGAVLFSSNLVVTLSGTFMSAFANAGRTEILQKAAQ